MAKVNLPEKKISTENDLKTVSSIVCFLGILGSLIVGYAYSFQEVYDGHSISTEFNPIGIGIALCLILSVLATYKVLSVLSEISITLKRIDCNNDPEYYNGKTDVSVKQNIKKNTPEQKRNSKRINPYFLTRSKDQTLYGLEIGDVVTLIEDNTQAEVLYFTEEGPIVLNTNDGRKAYDIDEIKC